jgi:hypothetical protein
VGCARYPAAGRTRLDWGARGYGIRGIAVYRSACNLRLFACPFHTIRSSACTRLAHVELEDSSFTMVAHAAFAGPRPTFQPSTTRPPPTSSYLGVRGRGRGRDGRTLYAHIDNSGQTDSVYIRYRLNIHIHNFIDPEQRTANIHRRAHVPLIKHY